MNCAILSFSFSAKVGSSRATASPVRATVLDASDDDERPGDMAKLFPTGTRGIKPAAVQHVTMAKTTLMALEVVICKIACFFGGGTGVGRHGRVYLQGAARRTNELLIDPARAPQRGR